MAEEELQPSRRQRRAYVAVPPDVKIMLAEYAAQNGASESEALRKMMDEYKAMRNAFTLEKLIDRASEFFNILFTRKKKDEITGQEVEVEASDIYKAAMLHAMAMGYMSMLMTSSASVLVNTQLEQQARMMALTNVQVSMPRRYEEESEVPVPAPAPSPAEMRLKGIRDRMVERAENKLLELAEKAMEPEQARKKDVNELLTDLLQPVVDYTKLMINKTMGAGKSISEGKAQLVIKEE